MDEHETKYLQTRIERLQHNFEMAAGADDPDRVYLETVRRNAAEIAAYIAEMQTERMKMQG